MINLRRATDRNTDRSERSGISVFFSMSTGFVTFLSHSRELTLLIYILSGKILNSGIALLEVFQHGIHQLKWSKFRGFTAPLKILKLVSLRWLYLLRMQDYW